MFEGGYQRFLDKNGWEDEAPETAQLPESPSMDRLSSKQIRKLRSEIITRRSKSLKPMETRLSAIEKDIEHHEARIADSSDAMMAATQENDGPRIVKLSQEIHHSQERIECLVWRDWKPSPLLTRKGKNSLISSLPILNRICDPMTGRDHAKDRK